MQGSEAKGSAGGEELVYNAPALVAAAHELKSPLALVRQLGLALESGSCSPKEVEILARRITLTSEKALRLTTDLTRASRLENSLFALEPLNPVAVLEEVAHELTPLYKAKGRSLYVQARKRPLLVIANRDLLRRIIINFTDNALHYSLDDEPVILSAQSLVSTGSVRVNVRDYGPSLPANAWNTIRSGLGKRAQALHARPESSGLGMYVAGQFAENMGARIGAVRHHNGASFYVELKASMQMRLL